MTRWPVRDLLCVCALAISCLLSWEVLAQTRIMPLGDSITQGGLGHASYRYRLWFDLLAAGYSVDFVGQRDFINGGGTPNPADYPDYWTTFDRDHEGYWGWRTDEVLTIVGAAAASMVPDIVMIQLGTNDIGQMGAPGVTNADANLRLIIPAIRAANPSVVIVLAQIPPLGPGTSYYANAAQVAPLNAAIAQIVTDLDETQSPVVLADQNSGFDLMTMLQGDGIHPNVLGEAQLASVWQAQLTAFLTAGNLPPIVTLTSPNTDVSYAAPVELLLTADAFDTDGAIVSVRFMDSANVIGIDLQPPYAITWASVPLGVHPITANAEDDEGSMTTSEEIVVTVVPYGSSVPIPVSNPSFEEPALSDGAGQSGPGSFGGWAFTASPNTFVGIFNPPIGSYASADGDATPTGAEGSNVAYLFNDGGAAEFVEATQLLQETLQPDQEYLLTVAIGRFNPSQPFSPSTYGGYRIELLAGTTVIAFDEDSFVPPLEEFQDSSAGVESSALPSELLGQPLSIRLTITANEADRSTHFDDVRLTRGVPAVPTHAFHTSLLLFIILLASGGVTIRRARAVGDVDR